MEMMTLRYVQAMSASQIKVEVARLDGFEAVYDRAGKLHGFSTSSDGLNRITGDYLHRLDDIQRLELQQDRGYWNTLVNEVLHIRRDATPAQVAEAVSSASHRQRCDALVWHNRRKNRGTIFVAIAAMAENRVIGKDGTIPWRVPEDFRWFARKTMGGTLVMGRKTFESIGRALPGRTTVVVSKTAGQIEGAIVVRSLEEIRPEDYPGPVFIAGGGQIYEEMLPKCSDVFLSIIPGTYEGDTFFPAFECDFALPRMVLDEQKFKVLHYTRKS